MKKKQLDFTLTMCNGVVDRHQLGDVNVGVLRVSGYGGEEVTHVCFLFVLNKKTYFIKIYQSISATRYEQVCSMEIWLSVQTFIFVHSF